MTHNGRVSFEFTKPQIVRILPKIFSFFFLFYFNFLCGLDYSELASSPTFVGKALKKFISLSVKGLKTDPLHGRGILTLK